MVVYGEIFVPHSQVNKGRFGTHKKYDLMYFVELYFEEELDVSKRLFPLSK